MILNYVDEYGDVINLEFPNGEISDEKSNPIMGGVLEKMDELQKSYTQQLAECQAMSDREASYACVDEAEKRLFIATGRFLAEAFFTRDNLCFQKYTTDREKGKGTYYVKKFHGIMIHSPASCQSALKTRESAFNQYSSKKSETGTHFIVDGDTGYVYSLLPLDCHANHCGKPMKTKKEPYEGSKSLNGQMIAIDIGEPGGVCVIGTAQAGSFPKEYREQIWRKMGSHYYGIAEKISAAEYSKLSEEGRAEWIPGTYTETSKKTGKETTITQYFRSSPEYVQKVREGVKKAYFAAAELAAGLCYLFGFNPLGKGEAQSFDKEKKKYSGTGKEVYDVVIGHVEGYKNFFKASNHGDPENMWKMEGVDYTMNTFREEVARQLELLRNRTKPVHPVLACIARTWKEGQPDKPETADGT
ncbi:MAG: N-acetylmuramoyl-L-alanine amidase [Lachnospiraceae bacterium]|nr:N-acetylmuramoyl-L-alanine amidase [Lachnospiraceae bacterium]MBO4767491.1 N-acetylmuramoyl-L-alanine amidase [Lachnospiraceae bacterium]